MKLLRRIVVITSKTLRLGVLFLLIRCFGPEGAAYMLSSLAAMRERFLLAGRSWLKVTRAIAQIVLSLSIRERSFMKKSTLVFISAVRDLLDLVVIGQVPGLNWILNAPVIYLHFKFAGPRALITLFENIPGIETLPCFTAMAISYPDPNRVDASVGKVANKAKPGVLIESGSLAAADWEQQQ